MTAAEGVRAKPSRQVVIKDPIPAPPRPTPAIRPLTRNAFALSPIMAQGAVPPP